MSTIFANGCGLTVPMFLTLTVFALGGDDEIPESAPPTAGFSHVLFDVKSSEGMRGYFSINTDKTRKMWYHYEKSPNGPPYSGWFTSVVVSRYPGDPDAYNELTSVESDYNNVRIFVNQDRIDYQSDGVNFKPHPIVRGRWNRNPSRAPNAFK